MVHVESEAIDEIDYQPASATLFVRFAHGGWYQYFGVPPNMYGDFLAAESHGHFFHDYIRERYPFRRGR